MEKCVLCNKKIKGYGNNPYPLAIKGDCCNKCNITKVIPLRIDLMRIRTEVDQ